MNYERTKWLQLPSGMVASNENAETTSQLINTRGLLSIGNSGEGAQRSWWTRDQRVPITTGYKMVLFSEFLRPYPCC